MQQRETRPGAACSCLSAAPGSPRDVGADRALARVPRSAAHEPGTGRCWDVIRGDQRSWKEASFRCQGSVSHGGITPAGCLSPFPPPGLLDVNDNPELEWDCSVAASPF